MRELLDSNDLEKIVGGAVIMSKQLNVVGFNTTGEVYQLKHDFKEMRAKLYELEDANEGMNNAEFDQLVKNTFLELGWI